MNKVPKEREISPVPWVPPSPPPLPADSKYLFYFIFQKNIFKIKWPESEGKYEFVAEPEEFVN